jgi:hypothetical protein
VEKNVRKLEIKISKTKAAMANPRPAGLEAHQCGPSTDSEKRYFGAKSTRISEKVQILALKMTIFQKCGPRADLDWPWLNQRYIGNYSLT